MAILTEVSNFDAAVYQIATTDPVEGGVGGIANLQAQALADRTRFLYNLLNSVIGGTQALTGWAPLASPPFTGSPTVPNLAPGDDSEKITNSAYVQGTVNGLAAVNVAGGVNVTLSAAQWGVTLIKLTGALTAGISVIFPTQSGWWLVQNATTGNFSLVCQTAAGTGVIVAPGAQKLIWCDGTNILNARTDFASVTLTGTTTVSGPLNVAGVITSSGNNSWTGGNAFSVSPTIPTAAPGDNSSKAANTAFVAAAVYVEAGYRSTADSNLATAINDETTRAEGVEATKQPLLGFTPVQQGGGTGQLTNKVYIGYDGTRPSIQIDATPFGEIVTQTQFPSSLSANGYKKYPDPNSPTGYFIEQWGSATVDSNPGGFSTALTLPIAYPNTQLWAIANWSGDSPPAGAVAGYNPNTSQILITVLNSAGTGTNLITWASKGY